MRMLRMRRYPRAELACPPLRWRAVGRRVLVASAISGIGGLMGAVSVLRWSGEADALWRGVAIVCFCVSGGSLLWLTHLVNAARTPVTFKIANGQLIVTKPFLFTRRRRRVATADVRDITVRSHRKQHNAGWQTGRLSIRRWRMRRAIRIPGRRPLAELQRVAEQLRAVLHV